MPEYVSVIMLLQVLRDFTPQYSTSAKKGLLIKTHKKLSGICVYFDDSAS